MAADRLTGKASYLTLNNTRLSLTKITDNTDRKLADTTDSGDYDQNSDMIYVTQLPVTLSTKFEVEGRFRLSQTPSSVIALCYSGTTAVPCIFGLNSGTVVGHGNFDISNFSCESPVDDVVTFKCTLMSNGLFTPNS